MTSISVFLSCHNSIRSYFSFDQCNFFQNRSFLIRNDTILNKLVTSMNLCLNISMVRMGITGFLTELQQSIRENKNMYCHVLITSELLNGQFPTFFLSIPFHSLQGSLRTNKVPLIQSSKRFAILTAGTRNHPGEGM